MITVVTLLAPRLLISLRRECYAPVPGVNLGTVVVPGGAEQHEEFELTWNARRPAVIDNDSTAQLCETYWSKHANQSLREDEEGLMGVGTD